MGVLQGKGLGLSHVLGAGCYIAQQAQSKWEATLATFIWAFSQLKVAGVQLQLVAVQLEAVRVQLGAVGMQPGAAGMQPRAAGMQLGAVGLQPRAAGELPRVGMRWGCSREQHWYSRKGLTCTWTR